VLVQSPKNSFNDGAGTTSAKMGCLRAKNSTVEGSKKADGVPDGAERMIGKVFGGVLGWVMGAMMVVGFVA
jgi:hypothetical protein